MTQVSRVRAVLVTGGMACRLKRKQIGKLLSDLDIHSIKDYIRFQIIHMNYAQQIKNHDIIHEKVRIIQIQETIK